MSDATRYCPSCGDKTDNEFCPKDGVATLARKKLDVDATQVHEGDVVDGRYRITGVLGRGGFGAVYSAEHTGTQQKMALKMMLPGSGADDAEVRRFYREAQVTANLKHQNTVRVFDVGQTKEGALYIAMEMLHGPTLEKVLKDRSNDGTVMTEVETIKMGIPILKALQEAHGQKLVHRDLKPANIMLADSGDDEPIVKVLDFGIARAQDSSLTGAGTALGTPAYMSPEQCQGGELDGRSDLYSLAVIMYRCVCGQPPFNDRNPLTIMFNHAQAAVPSIPENARTPVSEGFVNVLNRALAKSREDRFASARDMRAAMERLIGNSTGEINALYDGSGMGGVPGQPTPLSTRTVSLANRTANYDVNSETIAATGVGATINGPLNGMTMPGAAPKKGKGLVIGIAVAMAAVAVGAGVALSGGKPPAAPASDPAAAVAADPAKAAQDTAAKAEAEKAAAAKAEAEKTEAAKAEAAKMAAARAEGAKAESDKAAAAKAEADKLEAVKAEAAKADKVEAAAKAAKARPQTRKPSGGGGGRPAGGGGGGVFIPE
jgi:hypothetical protein